jgi:hypothetical protein
MCAAETEMRCLWPWTSHRLRVMLFSLHTKTPAKIENLRER